MAQTVKHLPIMWETQVLSLYWEDPLQKGMATHASTLAWEIPWTEGPGELESMGSQRVGYDLATRQQQEDLAETSVLQNSEETVVLKP